MVKLPKQPAITPLETEARRSGLGQALSHPGLQTKVRKSNIASIVRNISDSQLTIAEINTLRLFKKGLSIKLISKKLNFSEATIKVFRSNIKRKTGFSIEDIIDIPDEIFDEIFDSAAILDDIDCNNIAIEFSNRWTGIEDREQIYRQIEAYAKNKGHTGIADYARSLFERYLKKAYAMQNSPASGKDSSTVKPSATNRAPAVPAVAPALWKDREPGETAPDFVRRIYGRWAIDGEGISKRVLRDLDPTLITELNKWAREEGNEIPSDIKILTVREENRRLLGAGPDAMREHLGEFTGAEAVREARRLTMAKHRNK